MAQGARARALHPELSASNPFAAPETAALYARGRPDHHRRTAARVEALLGTAATGRGLDVACGSGGSTVALQGMATDVVGIDVAPAMVAVAREQQHVSFAAATAERLPFADGRFRIVHVGSAVHWFDQPAFFAEALRVLEPAGVVAVTEHFFLGEMDGAEGFSDWMRGAYVERYPTPPRGRHLPLTDDVPAGFELLGKDNWLDPIALTAGQLVDYLLSQSNTVAAVDEGREARPETRRWLDEQLSSFFVGGGSRTLRFWGTAACYRAA